MMLQSIRTKYLAQTNHKPARIKAIATSGKSLTLSRSMELNHEADHTRVARMLAYQLGWMGQWHGGMLDNNGYVFVISSSPIFTTSFGDSEIAPQ